MLKKMILPLVFLTTACANHRPAQNSNVEIPVVAKFFEQKNSAKRIPSSLNENEGESNVANKRVYFLALYTQLQGLNSLLAENKSELQSCPYFHTDWVNNRNSAEIKKNHFNFLSQYKHLSSDKYSYYPELYLNYDEQGKKLFEIVQAGQEIGIGEMKMALKMEQESTIKELKELCQYGQTGGLYVFENYLTYHKNNTSLPQEKMLKQLLKNQVFTNMLVLHSLTSHQKSEGVARKPAVKLMGSEMGSWEEEMTKRMNIPWLNQYLSHLSMNRK